jgi:hypothetical protein
MPMALSSVPTTTIRPAGSTVTPPTGTVPWVSTATAPLLNEGSNPPPTGRTEAVTKDNTAGKAGLKFWLAPATTIESFAAIATPKTCSFPLTLKMRVPPNAGSATPLGSSRATRKSLAPAAVLPTTAILLTCGPDW